MSTPRKEKCDCCGRKIALVKSGWKFGECEKCGYTTCEECLPDIMVWRLVKKSLRQQLVNDRITNLVSLETVDDMPNGVIISPMNSGKIFYDDKELRFKDPYRLRIQFGGMLWKFDHQTQDELRFNLVEYGYAGAGNMLIQWRKRQSKENQTQAYAATAFGVTQSAISKMESGKRAIPRKILMKIFEDFQKHKRNRIPPP